MQPYTASCPQCHASLSEGTSRCPACGFPRPPRVKLPLYRRPGITLIMILFSVAVVVALPLGILAVRYLGSAIQTMRRSQERSATPPRPPGSASAPSKELPADPASLRGTGQVYLIPIGEVTSVSIPELVDHIRRSFGLSIRVLPAISLPSAAEDAKRGQVVAEELITRMKLAYPSLADDPEAQLIGITDRDMYIWHYDWNYALNLRLDNRFAVLSTARLDPTFDEEPADAVRLESRIRKMLTKDLGLLHFGLSLSHDPSSALYDGIDVGEDLGEMRDFFTAQEAGGPAVPPRPETGRILLSGNGYPCWNLVHVSPRTGQVSGWQWLGECNEISSRNTTAEAYSVDLRTGVVYIRRTEFVLLPSPHSPYRMTRLCRNRDPYPRPFGQGCSHSLAILLSSKNPRREMDVVLEDSSAHYLRTTPPLFFWPTVYEQTGPGGWLQGSRIDEKFPWRGWVLSVQGGVKYEFNTFGYLESIRDSSGGQLLFKRSGNRQEHLLHIQTLPETHGILFDLDSAGRILRATSDSDGTAFYTYDERGRLITVAASVWLLHYRYDDQGNVLAVADAQDQPVLTMEYDSKGRIARQFMPDGRSYEFRFVEDAHGAAVRTDIVDQRGRVISAFFDGDDYRIVMGN